LNLCAWRGRRRGEAEGHCGGSRLAPSAHRIVRHCYIALRGIAPLLRFLTLSLRFAPD
jgi:hypothetical protein